MLANSGVRSKLRGRVVRAALRSEQEYRDRFSPMRCDPPPFGPFPGSSGACGGAPRPKILNVDAGSPVGHAAQKFFPDFSKIAPICARCRG
jgi:hypothetical protein